MTTVTQVFLAVITVTVLLPLCFANFRCQPLCDQGKAETEECDHCRSRVPIRFGKRVSPEIDVRVKGPVDLSPSHLLSLLLQQAESKGQLINNDQSDVQFQLNYQ